MSRKTNLGQANIGPKKKKTRRIVQQEENESSIRFRSSLGDIASLLDFSDRELEMYFENIQDELQKEMPDFDIPRLFAEPASEAECYDVTNQLLELVSFYKLSQDHDEAKDLFVKSYIQNFRHVSQANPTLQKDFKRVAQFRALEEVTEGLEGVGICKICNGTKIQVKVKGTRSADEALTVTYTCSNCKAAGKNIQLLRHD